MDQFNSNSQTPMQQQTTQNVMPQNPPTRQKRGGAGWKVLSALSLVLLLATLSGGAWVYTLYDDAQQQTSKLAAENQKLIDMAESSRTDETDSAKSGDMNELETILSNISHEEYSETGERPTTALDAKYGFSNDDTPEGCVSFAGQNPTQQEIETAIDGLGFNGALAGETIYASSSSEQKQLLHLCDFNQKLIMMQLNLSTMELWAVEVGPEGYTSDGVNLPTMDGYYQVFTDFSDHYLLFRNGYGDAGYTWYNYIVADLDAGTLDTIEKCSNAYLDLGGGEARELSCQRTYNLD